MIKTPPWPEWVRSLDLVAMETVESRKKNARHPTSFRSPAAMKQTLLGATAAALSTKVASMQMVGRSLTLQSSMR
jgi:hypothetical protein